MFNLEGFMRSNKKGTTLPILTPSQVGSVTATDMKRYLGYRTGMSHEAAVKQLNKLRVVDTGNGAVS